MKKFILTIIGSFILSYSYMLAQEKNLIYCHVVEHTNGKVKINFQEDIDLYMGKDYKKNVFNSFGKKQISFASGKNAIDYLTKYDWEVNGTPVKDRKGSMIWVLTHNKKPSPTLDTKQRNLSQKTNRNGKPRKELTDDEIYQIFQDSH